MRPILSILIVFIFLICNSCNEDTVANLTIFLVPTHNGQPISAGDIVEDVNGRNFSISEMRMYFTDFFLIKDSGEKVLLEDLALIEWPGATSDISMNINKDDYQGFEFNIGLDPVTNDSDPNSFLADHPLSDEMNMHLGADRYVFLSFEGLVDTSASGNDAPSSQLLYRLGRNAIYSEVKIVQNLDITGSIVFFSLDFEINRLFTGSSGTIDIAEDRINNSEEANMPNALTVMENFVEALEAD